MTSIILAYIVSGLAGAVVLAITILYLCHRRERKEFDREIRNNVENVSEQNTLQSMDDQSHWRESQQK